MLEVSARRQSGLVDIPYEGIQASGSIDCVKHRLPRFRRIDDDGSLAQRPHMLRSTIEIVAGLKILRHSISLRIYDSQ